MQTAMDFVNLTPYSTDVVDDDGNTVTSVEPSGTVAIAAGDQLINVPPPQAEVRYIVLPAISQASERDDLLSVDLSEADRSYRGNVRSHVVHWSGS